MKKLMKRPSPAVFIALLALVVALGGPSYAAKMITGKNIKNSSITGQDIKNGSLTGQDVKKSSITGQDVKKGSLTGQDVKDGSLSKQDLKAGTLSGTFIPRVTMTATPGATYDEALAGLRPGPSTARARSRSMRSASPTWRTTPPTT